LSPKSDRAAAVATGSFATFEDAYRELQQVIEQLDDGGLGLDEAVRLFERGSELVRVCQRIVEDAELRVTRLAAESATTLTESRGGG
jgi:exodeoxyribonuclease VII small subunit